MTSNPTRIASVKIASEVRSWSLTRDLQRPGPAPAASGRGRLEQLLDGLGEDRSAVGDDGGLRHFVLEVEVESSVLDQPEQECRDVPGVERGRTGGGGRRAGGGGG